MWWNLCYISSFPSCLRGFRATERKIKECQPAFFLSRFEKTISSYTCVKSFYALERGISYVSLWWKIWLPPSPFFVYTVSKKRGEVERGEKRIVQGHIVVPSSSSKHLGFLLPFYFAYGQIVWQWIMQTHPTVLFSRKTVAKGKYTAEFLGFLALMRDRYQAAGWRKYSGLFFAGKGTVGKYYSCVYSRKRV